MNELAGIGVWGEPVGGEKGEENVLLRAADLAEHLQLLPQLSRVFLGDGERALGELDLDQVDGLICSISGQKWEKMQDLATYNLARL